jgi:hypothetical protein
MPKNELVRTNGDGTAQTTTMQRSHRGPDDDFFCLRYQVWYPSFDCAVRTRFRTSPGCLACEQGRFNLRRHEDALVGRLGPRLARRFAIECASISEPEASGEAKPKTRRQHGRNAALPPLRD